MDCSLNSFKFQHITQFKNSRSGVMSLYVFYHLQEIIKLMAIKVKKNCHSNKNQQILLDYHKLCPTYFSCLPLISNFTFYY